MLETLGLMDDFQVIKRGAADSDPLFKKTFQVVFPLSFNT